MLPRMVISVDGLNARFLGAYGNSWIPTPTIDSLAGRGLLFDQYYAEHGCPESLLQSQLSGKHPLIADLDAADPAGFSVERNQDSLLVTDFLGLPTKLTDFFSKFVEVPLNPDQLATDQEELFPSHFQRVFETALAAIENLQLWNTNSLIWIHCHGMYSDWDAPLEFQEIFKGEEDPEAIETGIAPAAMLQPDHDPDERVRWQHAYAAQVIQLDQVLGDFLSVLWDRLPDLPVTFGGLRGFALGEHLEIGDVGAALHVEKTHLPLIHVDHREAPLRIATQLGTQAFYDLFTQANHPQALEELLAQQEALQSRPTIVTTAYGSYARLQTDGWSYVQELDQGMPVNQAGKLYRRPDDRLEANDVADLCPEVVEELNLELKRRLLCYQNGTDPTEMELSEQATFGIE